MTRLIVLALFVTPALPATAEFRPKTESELTYNRDGDDLIISTTILVPGGPHLVLTTFDSSETMPRLKYTVIRNADVFGFGWKDGLHHALKSVKIEWRLKGFSKTHPGLAPYSVFGEVIALSNEELIQLGGKAADLAKRPE